jgi:hypothetical protein
VKLTSQEKLDLSAVAAGIAALLVLLGMLITPQPSAAPAPLPDSIAAVSVSVDSESEPSGVLGMTTGELLQDAWTSYQAIQGPEKAPSGQYTTSPEYAASFYGAVPKFPGDYFTLESKQRPNVFHVFHMVASQRA